MVELFEPDLLRQFVAGSDSAFTAVYRRYAGPMFAIALRTCGHRELAAEAVQQAFVQVWRACRSGGRRRRSTSRPILHAPRSEPRARTRSSCSTRLTGTALPSSS